MQVYFTDVYRATLKQGIEMISANRDNERERD